MKIKILKPSDWYKHFVGSEFEVDKYDKSPTNLRFRVEDNGWIFNDDCVITELPKSFCVKRCDDKEKWKKYIQWLNKTYFDCYMGSCDGYYGSIEDSSCYEYVSFGTEIHIDDMIKHIEYMERHIKGGEQFSKESQLIAKMDKIIKEETNMNTQKLSRQGLKEIHSVACARWKEALEHYGTRNPLENYIELSEQEVKTMFNECTKEQLPIVSKYLKKDEGLVNLTNIKTDSDSIWLGDNCIITPRTFGEYKGKAFCLEDNYKWEIKKDSQGVLCLIPTKKK